MNADADAEGVEVELERERQMGGLGEERSRAIPRVDLSSFDERFPEIADELWTAASTVGFFQVVGHGIAQEQIDRAFQHAESFFGLPTDAKADYPMAPGTNAGWEDRAQIRPSTGTPDQKETFQITVPRMGRLGLWPDAHLPEFRHHMLAFAEANHRLGMRILSCFAVKLGFDRDFFQHRHNPSSTRFQSTLRLLHYYPSDDVDSGLWRAGAHTDYDCLTLLHQRPGEGGLQVCPGAERDAAAWTPVSPLPGVVTCNIGDMLMRWSDDRLASTLHRVVMPPPEDSGRDRYSLAYFCQADEDAVISGPSRTYPPITAEDYIRERLAANFPTT